MLMALFSSGLMSGCAWSSWCCFACVALGLVVAGFHVAFWAPGFACASVLSVGAVPCLLLSRVSRCRLWLLVAFRDVGRCVLLFFRCSSVR